MSTPRSVIVVEPDPYLAVTVEALLASVHPTPELIAVADLEELRDWARPTGVVVAGPALVGEHRDPRAALRELREGLDVGAQPGVVGQPAVVAGERAVDVDADPDGDALQVEVVEGLEHC